MKNRVSDDYFDEEERLHLILEKSQIQNLVKKAALFGANTLASDINKHDSTLFSPTKRGLRISIFGTECREVYTREVKYSHLASEIGEVLCQQSEEDSEEILLKLEQFVTLARRYTNEWRKLKEEK